MLLLTTDNRLPATTITLRVFRREIQASVFAVQLEGQAVACLGCLYFVVEHAPVVVFVVAGDVDLPLVPVRINADESGLCARTLRHVS